MFEGLFFLISPSFTLAYGGEVLPLLLKEIDLAQHLLKKSAI
jgi:hypothetical protein